MDKKQALLRRIWAYDFALLELNLYLDTHPDCQQGLAALEKIRNDRAAAVREYERQYGDYVVTVNDVKPSRRFTWVDNPWPWENEANI